jgi:hypothetical protein
MTLKSSRPSCLSLHLNQLHEGMLLPVNVNALVSETACGLLACLAVVAGLKIRWGVARQLASAERSRKWNSRNRWSRVGWSRQPRRVARCRGRCLTASTVSKRRGDNLTVLSGVQVNIALRAPVVVEGAVRSRAVVWLDVCAVLSDVPAHMNTTSGERRRHKCYRGNSSEPN